MGSLRRVASDFFGRGWAPPEASYDNEVRRVSSQRRQRSQSPSTLDDLSYLFKSAKAAITGAIPPPNPYVGDIPPHVSMSRGNTARGGPGHRDELFFGQYTHLPQLPDADYALLTLKRLASAVMPIMRKRGWRVGTLSEFYPDQPNLLGLNVNQGQQIMVRLRSPYNVKNFMVFEHCLDTLLHELSHIVRGPHDEQFHRVWNELRAEWETLAASGYTGEGFLGKGNQLGGNYMPAEEVRRRARASAANREKDRIKRGRRLGGESSDTGRSGSMGVRDAVAVATIKRLGDKSSSGKGKGSDLGGSTEEITAGCGQGSKRAEQEAKDALVNGFKTKDDMDEANWLAIQEAQFELEEFEEQRRLRMGLPPTDPSAGPSLLPSGSSDGMYTWDPEYGLRPAGPGWRKPEEPTSSRTKSAPPVERRPPEVNSQGKPVSRLVKEAEQTKPRKKPTNSSSGQTSSSSRPSSSDNSSWACSACTFVNSNSKTKCEMCENLRPKGKKRAPSKERNSPSSFSQSLGWNCPRCTSFMGHEWWTCSNCGSMKLSS